MQSEHSRDHVSDPIRNSPQAVAVAPPSNAEVHTIAAASTEAYTPSAPRAKRAIEIFSGLDVTDEMVEEAAKLFSEHYGVWSQHAPNNKPGNRVRMSAARLRKQCLPSEVLAHCTYVRYMQNGRLVGNAFACTWTYGSGKKEVCWITQLVVETSMRSQGIATKMLVALRDLDIGYYGIITSHPYACCAMAHAFENTQRMKKVREYAQDFLHDCGTRFLKSSPIEYVRTAKLRHAPAWDAPSYTPYDGTEYTVNTSFYVDHTEQKAILEAMQGSGKIWGDWDWGDLLEGYEHLMIVLPELSHWRDTILRHTTWEAGHRLARDPAWQLAACLQETLSEFLINIIRLGV